MTLSRRIPMTLLAFVLLGTSGIVHSQNSQTDLFAYSEGARFVRLPADGELTHMYESPLNLIDGSATTDWTGAASGPPTFVLELEEQTELRRIAFDNAFLNRDEKAARAVTVEISDTSATSGFVPILSVSLRPRRDNQNFDFSPENLPVGRWIRLTVQDNQAGDDYSALTGFRGYGRKLTANATTPDITGTYEGWSGWGKLSLTQNGDRVSGCYEYQDGQVSGVIEGRTIKLDMVETASDGTVAQLRGYFGISANGGKLIGIARGLEESDRLGYATYMSADRIGRRAATCD